MQDARRAGIQFKNENTEYTGRKRNDFGGKGILAVDFWFLFMEIILLLLGALVLGIVAQRLKQSPILGYLLAGILAGVRPAANRPLYVLLVVLTFPIGWVVSHVVFAAVFLGIITPVGLVFRVIGRDVLERRFDAEARSYWRPRPRRTDVRRYFRQF